MSGDEFLEFRAFVLHAQNMIQMKRLGQLVFLKTGTCFNEFGTIHTSITHSVTHKRCFFSNDACHRKKTGNFLCIFILDVKVKKNITTEIVMSSNENLTLR